MVENLNIIVEHPLFNITFFGCLIFIVVGFMMFKFPPKNINALYGYRTSSSMENQEKWDFAQKYSSIELIKFGFLLVISSFFSLFTWFDNLTNMFVGLGLIISIVILILLRVEKAINIKFSDR